MIIYCDTTVFNVEVQTVVNTVNCVGAMGAGLALEFKLRYPEMYQDYVIKCEKKLVKPGIPYVYREYEEQWIVNFPTKNHWRYPSKIEWIEQGLKFFAKKYKDGGVTSIAFPKLGCDNGKLNWEDVRFLMDKYLNPLDLEIYICLDKDKQASGIESRMLEKLNNNTSYFLQEKLNLRKDTLEQVYSSLPLKRFRHLSSVRNLGKKTYADIFRLLYLESQKESNNNCNLLKENEEIQEKDIDTDLLYTLSKIEINRRDKFIFLFSHYFHLSLFEICTIQKKSLFYNNKSKTLRYFTNEKLIEKSIPNCLESELLNLLLSVDEEKIIFSNLKNKKSLSANTVKKIIQQVKRKITDNNILSKTEVKPKQLKLML